MYYKIQQEDGNFLHFGSIVLDNLNGYHNKIHKSPNTSLYKEDMEFYKLKLSCLCIWIIFLLVF